MAPGPGRANIIGALGRSVVMNPYAPFTPTGAGA